MGRFAQESHTDLREWYVHLLDFRALKRRLIDDPPDPYDDHPSMSGPTALASDSSDAVGNSRSSASASADGGGIRGHLSDPELTGEGLLMADQGGSVEARDALLGDGVAEASGRWRSRALLAGQERDGGRTYLVCPDPSSRVFVFEINQELERIWAFYRGESSQCASKLSSLHDASAFLRHQLHRKLGGAEAAGVGGSSSSSTDLLLDDAELQYRPPSSRGAGLRPSAAEEHLLGGGGSGSDEAASKPRIRGRKSMANLNAQAEEAWVPPAPAADADGGGPKTTEDPYVQASLKRSIVELYDTCHRLLSFKMLNYDAFVRLIELHCRREGDGLSSSPPPSWAKAKVAGFAGDWDGAEGGAVGGPSSSVASASAAEVPVAGVAAESASSCLSREKAMKVWLLEQPLFASRELSSTLSGAELLYASLFCNGDVDVARTALTFKASSSLRGNRRFDFGYRLGAATILLAWAAWDCIGDDSLGKDVWHDPAFKIYRGLGNLVLLVYMWGVNIWVWRRFGIDYERCLSLDPKGPRVDPCEQVWNTGCNLSIAFLLSFICFYKALRGVLLNPTLVPIQFAHTFPLLLLFYVLLCFLTPWSERKPLLKVLWTVIISPFGKVRFLEGYVGDILTSVVRVLIDVAFAFLYFLSGVRGWLGNSLDLTHDPITNHPLFSQLLVPLLMVAPLWWRFQQNLRRSYETRQRWPHLGNALKYATAMSVSLFGTFQPQMHSSWLWVFCFVFATLYQFTWDVIMDWDLLRWDGRSLRLRPRLLYRNKNLYIGVALVNLALRFLWTVTLVPENAPNLFPKDFQIYFSPVTAAAEILRRTMWGFLRVENEHLHIYGDLGSCSSPGLDEPTGFQRNASTATASSSGSSVSSPGSGSGAGVPMLGGVAEKMGFSSSGGGGRGGGLDRLPYSRVEAPSIGIVPRVTSFMKAWCLTRVKRESRCRLLVELGIFSLALVSIGLIAGLS